MANFFEVNVYGINNQSPLSTPQRFGFNAESVIFRPIEGEQFAANGTTRLYGIVQVQPTGLNISQPQYLTVQTVSQLVTLANA